MKIIPLTYQQNNNKITYQGGMNSKIKSEIMHTDCNKIQNSLLDTYDIKADFAGNKIIALSINKVTHLLNELQEKYNLKIWYPAFIFTGKPENYDIDINLSDYTYGFTNFLPCKFNKNSNDTVPGMSIIFNENYPWEKLDEKSDLNFELRHSTTNHFLEPFLHEYGHINHEGNLLTKYAGQELLDKFNELLNHEFISKYKIQYANIIREYLCNYASESPLETIACDMSKRFIDNLDLKELEFKQNPFKASPYEGFSIRKIFKQKTPLDIMLKAIYNGKTDIITK